MSNTCTNFYIIRSKFMLINVENFLEIVNIFSCLLMAVGSPADSHTLVASVPTAHYVLWSGSVWTLSQRWDWVMGHWVNDFGWVRLWCVRPGAWLGLHGHSWQQSAWRTLQNSDTVVKPLLRYCFETVNDRVGLGHQVKDYWVGSQVKNPDLTQFHLCSQDLDGRMVPMVRGSRGKIRKSRGILHSKVREK